MADVFISYKREDKPAVQRIVEAVRGAGVSVWWDQDIAPDAPWEATIERELAEAKCVIVAWSLASVASDNVKAEAREARQAGKLIQVFVEACKPPLFFGERQGVDLSAWKGDAADRRFQTVLAAVRAVVEGRRPPDGVGYASKRRLPVALATAGLAIAASAVSIVANAGGARDWLCATSALHELCEQAGLATLPATPAPDPTFVAAAARTALLARVEGVWGNVGQDGAAACTIRLTYSIESRGEEDVVLVRGDAFESVARVVSVGGGSVFTRTVSPAERAGEQGEVRLEADRLFQVDKNNIATPLVRCGD